MATPEEIKEREEERDRYLAAFYDLTVDQPLRWATHRQIAEVARIPEERIMAISMQLQADGLVQLRTMGGVDGSVELTSQGVRVAEAAIKDAGARPAEALGQVYESEEQWATTYLPMLKLAFKAFKKDRNWPEIDALQRALDRTGVGLDVRDGIVTMPRLPGEAVAAYPMNLHIPLRILRFVPDAASVLSACLEIIRRAVELYYSEAEQLEVSSGDSWVALAGDSETVTTAARLLLNDFPNPFAGGGYGPHGWSLSVNGSMARRFRDLGSIDDYVARQREIREQDSRQYAALVQMVPAPMAGAVSAADEAARQEIRDGPSIFVMMPFGESWSQGVYDFIRRAIRSIGYPNGCRIVRADDITAPGKIDQQIIGAIRAATIVVADITGTNANVMWELGYAQAAMKAAVIMNQRVGDSPFDLASTRQVSYRLAPTDDDEIKLADHIRSAVEEARGVP